MGDKNIKNKEKSSKDESLDNSELKFVGSTRKQSNISNSVIEVSDKDEELKDFDLEFVNNPPNLSDNDRIKTALLVNDKDIEKDTPKDDLEWMKVVDILKRDDDGSIPEIPFDNNNIREDRYEIKHDQNGEYIYDKKNERSLRFSTIRKLLTQREGLLLDLKSIGEEVCVILQGSDNYQNLKKALKEFVKIWKRSLDTIDIEFEDRYEVMQRQKEKYIHDKKNVKPLRLEEVKKLLIETESLNLELKEILNEIQVMIQKCDNYQDLYNNVTNLV